MPIKPFKDKDKFQFEANVTRIRTKPSGSAAFPNIDKFRQGVSLRNSLDVYSSRLLPFMGSRRLPDRIDATIDFSIDRTTYGDVQFSIKAEDGIGSTPFYDIDSLKDPVQFLKDNGITAYPQIMISPNWLDPGMLNGIIEPLSVRGTLPGFNIDAPFVAHSIKGEIMESPVRYTTPNPGKRKNQDPAFDDSQDLAMKGDGINLHAPGIGDFGTMPISPFNESKIMLRNNLKNMSGTEFNDNPKVGIDYVAVSSNFNFNTKKVVSVGLSGYRSKTVVESIAFGGLVR